MPAPVFGNNNLALTVGTTDYPCIHLPAELHLAPDQRESFIEIPEGCEPIKARVWMAKSQLDALPADVKSGATPVGIKMSGQAFDTIAPTTVDQRTIETGAKMYLVKASVVQHGINDSIYELQLRGEQWFWKRGAYTDNYYNVLGPDRKTYSMGYGADSSTAKTFQEIVTALAGQLGISLTLPSTPTWVPQNVYSDSSPGALLDRLLRPMGMRVVCDPWTVFTYSIEQLDYTDTVDESHLTALSAVAGHEGCNVARDITPAVYRPEQAACRFPQSPFPSGNSNRFYTESATSNPVSGGKGVALINVGDYYYRSDNHTQITNIANERCTNFFKRVNIPHETWTFIGGYELAPRSTIRKVRVTMDLDGWFTVVTRHGLALPLRADNEDQQFWPDSARWPEHNAIDGGVIPIPSDDGTCNFEVGISKFWVKITGHTAEGSSGGNRWVYAGVEMTPGLRGAWNVLSGGRTITEMWNTFEANNSAAGEQGSGDNVTNFPTGITLLPLGIGAVVEVTPSFDCATPPNPIYYFSAPNNPGGSCP